VKLAMTNPAQTLQGVKQGRRVPKALSTQEIYRRQRTAAGQRQRAVARAGETVAPTVIAALRDEAVLNLLLYTGLRVGEAAALRLDDVVTSYFRHPPAARGRRRPGDRAALMGNARIATTQICTQPGEADMIRAVDRLG
jgi:site-specific recombinase XerD